MSKETTPIFIVGSGRSGTRMIFKLLSGIDDLEIYHEYLCTHIQQTAAMYYMQLMSKEETKKDILKLHGAAIYYSKSRYLVDCSNKLSWIIEPLFELFPHAKFINLIRDGRKVANSFFQKLGPEMYDDESVSVLQSWLLDRDLPVPPPEKKYWWNIPLKNQQFGDKFPGFNRFQRCCYHWVESNRVVKESLKIVPQNQQLTIRLEDLTADKGILKKFLSFFDLEYDDSFYDLLQTPQNVFFPMDFKLTEDQKKEFNDIADDMMRELGYADKPEYTVKY